MAAPHVTGAVARYLAAHPGTLARPDATTSSAPPVGWTGTSRSDPVWSGVADPDDPHRLLDVGCPAWARRTLRVWLSDGQLQGGRGRAPGARPAWTCSAVAATAGWRSSAWRACRARSAGRLRPARQPALRPGRPGRAPRASRLDGRRTRWQRGSSASMPASAGGPRGEPPAGACRGPQRTQDPATSRHASGTTAWPWLPTGLRRPSSSGPPRTDLSAIRSVHACSARWATAAGAAVASGTASAMVTHDAGPAGRASACVPRTAWATARSASRSRSA